MKVKNDVSLEGQRIGYLYDLATPDEKKTIDEILGRYDDAYPLIYILGRRDKSLMPLDEARDARALFTRAIESRKVDK